MIRTNVGRRLEVLVALMEGEAASGGSGLGVVAAAEAVGREKTQVSRALRLLEDAELIERDSDTLAYLTGPKLLRLATHAGDPGLLSKARPVLERLAQQTGERAHISVLRGAEVLTIDTVQAAAGVQAVGWVGRATPAHGTADGMVLLSEHDEGAVRDLLGEDPLPAAGPSAPTTLDTALQWLHEVRSAGFAVSDEALASELIAIAAPVHDPGGSIVAAVNVSGPDFRMRTRVAKTAGLVQQAAADISADLDAAG